MTLRFEFAGNEDWRAEIELDEAARADDELHLSLRDRLGRWALRLSLGDGLALEGRRLRVKAPADRLIALAPGLYRGDIVRRRGSERKNLAALLVQVRRGMERDPALEAARAVERGNAYEEPPSSGDGGAGVVISGGTF